jgi:hypothetical protein
MKRLMKPIIQRGTKIENTLIAGFLKRGMRKWAYWKAFSLDFFSFGCSIY